MPASGSPARTLDMAKGILILLRQCSADQTFTELVEVRRKYALSPFSLAAALVVAAGGGPDPRGNNANAASAVEQQWGSLLSAISAPGPRPR